MQAVKKKRKYELTLDLADDYNYLSYIGEKYSFNDNGGIGKCIGTTSSTTSSR